VISGFIIDSVQQAGSKITIPTCVRDVLSLSFGQDTDYPMVFRGSSQYFHANAGMVLQLRPRVFPSTSFSIHSSLIILTFDTIQYEL
jgi:hypothetical protein